MEENLPELRDIYLPEGVSIWPLSYGWWIIIFGIFITILLIQTFFFVYRRNKKRYALKLIENISSTSVIDSARHLSEILRRICIHKYKEAVSLSGKDWVNFLNDHCKNKLADDAAALLVNAPYISSGSSKHSVESLNKLQEFVKQWIGENL